MTAAENGRKVAKAVTSVVVLGSLGTIGLGSAALYGTITADNAAKLAARQSTVLPDSSGTSGSSSGSDSQTTPQPSSGTQLLPGSGGASHTRSSGS